MKIFGHTCKNLTIGSYEFGSQGPQVLILAGVHGNEPEGIYVANALLSSFIKKFEYDLRLTLVPILNIEGALTATRTNANKIDLNRNMPTKDWTSKYDKQKYYPGESAGSEPENQALIKWIDANQPQLVISLHSWKPMINTNGDCNPEAAIISQETGYKTTDYIGYPTPGNLGDYCVERSIPAITYEVEKGLDIKSCIEVHAPAIQKALLATQKRT